MAKFNYWDLKGKQNLSLGFTETFHRRCRLPCRRTRPPSSIPSTWPTTLWTTKVEEVAEEERDKLCRQTWLTWLNAPPSRCCRCFQPHPAGVSPQQGTPPPEPLKDLSYLQRSVPWMHNNNWMPDCQYSGVAIFPSGHLQHCSKNSSFINWLPTQFIAKLFLSRLKNARKPEDYQNRV